MEWLVLIAVASVGYIWWLNRNDRNDGGKGGSSGGSDLK